TTVLSILGLRTGVDGAVHGLHDDVWRAAVLSRVVEFELELRTSKHLFNEERVGVVVQVISNLLSANVMSLQPDQCDVVVLNEAARTGGAGVSIRDGNPGRVGSSVEQSCNQICKVSRLVNLHRIDRRLSVLRGDDKQGRIVNTLALECLDHAGQGLVGL